LSKKVGDNVVFGPRALEEIASIFRDMAGFVRRFFFSPSAKDFRIDLLTLMQVSFLNSVVMPDPNMTDDESDEDEEGDGDEGEDEEGDDDGDEEEEEEEDK
jgi:hypothetical protein